MLPEPRSHGHRPLAAGAAWWSMEGGAAQKELDSKKRSSSCQTSGLKQGQNGREKLWLSHPSYLQSFTSTSYQPILPEAIQQGGLRYVVSLSHRAQQGQGETWSQEHNDLTGTLAVWPWATHLTFWASVFLICKMESIVLVIKEYNSCQGMKTV